MESFDDEPPTGKAYDIEEIINRVVRAMKTRQTSSSHRNADALSKRPCPESCVHRSCMEKKFDTICDLVTVTDERWNKNSIRAGQERNLNLRYVSEWKGIGTRSTWEELALHTPEAKS